jgi:hypothetical protein
MCALEVKDSGRLVLGLLSSSAELSGVLDGRNCVVLYLENGKFI